MSLWRLLPPAGVLRSAFRRPEAAARRPRYPTIDAHTHLNSSFAGRWRRRPARDVLRAMDEAGIDGLVDLDGGFGDRLTSEVRRVQIRSAGRIAVFAGIDQRSIRTHADFGVVEANRLRDSVTRGARGLKIWKSLGLEAKDPSGLRIPLDDERLDPLWDAAADVHVPVLVHVGDPPAFFQPLDADNERLEELRRHPQWHYHPIRSGPDEVGFPSLEELIRQFEHVVAAHPRTTFIGAHLASCGEDLPRLGAMLRANPNLNVDISARINELGRQRDAARSFLVEFSDRVLFGTDSGPDPRWYPVYAQFLESSMRDMNYSIYDPPLQGRWRVDALSLPDAVLARIYGENARRLIRFGP